MTISFNINSCPKPGFFFYYEGDFEKKIEFVYKQMDLLF